MSTQSLEPRSNEPKRRDVPIWAAFTTLLVLAVTSIAVLAFVLHRTTSDKTRLEKQKQALELEKGKAEIDRQKAVEQGKLAIARTRQTDSLAQVRIATNACAVLLQNLQEFEKDAAALRTSDAGRQVAKHPDLVILARRLYEVDLRELPQKALVISKLEGVRRLESQLVAAAGTSFEPDASFVGTAQADMIWANQEASKVQRARSLIATLAEEAKIKIPPQDAAGKSVTLEAAIANLAQNEVAARQRVITAKTEEAKTLATTTVAAVESNEIINEAKRAAARILDEANAKAAKLEQEQRLREADLKVQESKVKVAVNQATDEAQKVQLRAKAKDPKVAVKLAPFTTPGYLQFGGSSYEKAPLSYTAIVQSGALAPTQAGLQRLADIAYTTDDKDRPRWRFKLNHPKGWTKDNNDREMVMEVQQLLIELGPVLAEMGALQK